MNNIINTIDQRSRADQNVTEVYYYLLSGKHWCHHLEIAPAAARNKCKKHSKNESKTKYNLEQRQSYQILDLYIWILYWLSVMFTG